MRVQYIHKGLSMILKFNLVNFENSTENRRANKENILCLSIFEELTDKGNLKHWHLFRVKTL